MSRSDGDSWDIVTSVGLTALGVCASRALDAGLSPPLAHDEFAAGFVAAAGEPNLAAAVANMDVDTTAGFNAGWVGVRTRFFDDFYGDATARGVPQAVIVAAGLDARAYRLSWPDHHTLFEVDQPRVLEFKQRVLDARAAVAATRRVTVAVDLRDDWAAALLEAGFDPARPTAWAMEGLLPYLPGAAQDALFERVDDLSAPGSLIAAELGPDPGTLARFADYLHRFGRDPTQAPIGELWYDDPRRDTPAWLTGRGWTVRGVDLVERATEYGRPFGELPEFFENLLRTKFFSAVRDR